MIMILKEFRCENKKKWLKVWNLEKCQRNNHFSLHFILAASFKLKMLFLVIMVFLIWQEEIKNLLFFQTKLKIIQKSLDFRKHAMEIFSISQLDKRLTNMMMWWSNIWRHKIEDYNIHVGELNLDNQFMSQKQQLTLLVLMVYF